MAGFAKAKLVIAAEHTESFLVQIQLLHVYFTFLFPSLHRVLRSLSHVVLVMDPLSVR